MDTQLCTVYTRILHCRSMHNKQVSVAVSAVCLDKAWLMLTNIAEGRPISF